MRFNATEQMINILLSNEDISRLTSGDIRPVVARYGAQIPYIVVSTENSEVRHTKLGGFAGITSDVVLTVVADTYEDVRYLTDTICDMQGGVFEIQSYKEDYGDEKYVVLIGAKIEQ